MSILTKKERASYRFSISDERPHLRGMFRWSHINMERALDTIDALEATIEELEAQNAALQERADFEELFYLRDTLRGAGVSDHVGIIDGVKSIIEGVDEAKRRGDVLIDKLDAMEAERDALREKLAHASPTFITMDSYAAQANAGAIDAIEEIAEANHNTRVVGGAHAALREILAVIRGADTEEGDQ